LIVQVHSVGGVVLFMLIPINTQNDYVWARFDRVGQLDPPRATDTLVPADQRSAGDWNTRWDSVS